MLGSLAMLGSLKMFGFAILYGKAIVVKMFTNLQLHLVFHNPGTKLKINKKLSRIACKMKTESF